MEIGRVGSKPTMSTDRKKLETKKDFSQSFNQAHQRKSQEELKKMLEDINKKGNRLVITKCYADVFAYKKMIKEYLRMILEDMYSVKKDVSFWQTQYFITVDTIDSKLEELTQSLLDQEKENLNIAATVDEIQGLIVDIYR
ncbi:YaaR family protein [Inconstantimicrobium mannanitabidum]|nr:YaaR family protein [Clostridium sp. TW13]